VEHVFGLAGCLAEMAGVDAACGKNCYVVESLFIWWMELQVFSGVAEIDNARQGSWHSLRH